MSRYKPYPAYKDSGVEWLGKVPEGWEVKRLRHVASFKNSNVDKKTYEDQISVKLCNYTDVYYNELITKNLSFMPSTASANEIEQFSLKKGDVIITKDSGNKLEIGVPALVSEEIDGIVCGYHMTIIRCDNFDTARILHRILQSRPTKAHFLVKALGVTIYGLSQDAIADTSFCLPPGTERRKIADHIDHETSFIDTLIQKNTRLMELLKEKRSALITHAVTKGLDPNVKMKDSGVEWIGEVPEGWEIRPVKHLYNARLGKMVQPQQKSDEEILVPYHRAQTVQWERVDYDQVEQMWANPAEVVTYSLEEGDLLICEGGDVCRAALFNQVKHERVIFQNSIHRVRSVDGNHPEWILRLMQHVRSSEWIDVLCNKNTIVHFTSEKLASLECPHPPPTEQAKILIALRSETASIDALIAKTKLSIDILKERRSAFITAAVTGQIDLREAA